MPVVTDRPKQQHTGRCVWGKPAQHFQASQLTKAGEFWSGQKDSGMGQCPTGTPVFGFGRT